MEKIILTNKDVDNVCLSYDHSFGLKTEEEKNHLRFICNEWIRAINNNIDYFEKSKGTKYFLKVDWDKSGWKQVTKEQFIKAERNCGFRSKEDGMLATGGFSQGSISGRIEY